ncbi:MAG: SDR family oxidoreductase [Chloroflexota bacterium]
MAILITGGAGFLGKALTKTFLERSLRVYSLSRHPPAPAENLIPLEGDILLPDLGLENVPADIDTVIHSAALLSFKPGDKDRLYETNCRGTENVIQWMKKHGITRLYHVSTAYLFGQNHYEISKKMAEAIVLGHTEIKVTILRPGIIIGDSRVQGLPPVSGFYIGIRACDQAKRWFERGTKLPPLTFKIRIAGNPQGRLNLIPVDIVAQNIVRLVEQDAAGIYYLTHPAPPMLKELEPPISLATRADVEFLPDFTPNVGDRLVARLIIELSPYLCGHDLPSDIECRRLTADFLQRTAEAFLNKT